MMMDGRWMDDGGDETTDCPENFERLLPAEYSSQGFGRCRLANERSTPVVPSETSVFRESGQLCFSCSASDVLCVSKRVRLDWSVWTPAPSAASREPLRPGDLRPSMALCHAACPVSRVESQHLQSRSRPAAPNSGISRARQLTCCVGLRDRDLTNLPLTTAGTLSLREDMQAWSALPRLGPAFLLPTASLYSL